MAITRLIRKTKECPGEPLYGFLKPVCTADHINAGMF